MNGRHFVISSVTIFNDRRMWIVGYGNQVRLIEMNFASNDIYNKSEVHQNGQAKGCMHNA